MNNFVRLLVQLWSTSFELTFFLFSGWLWAQFRLQYTHWNRYVPSKGWFSDGVKMKFVRNSFDSNRKFATDSKRQKRFKNFDENWFKFYSFDLTATRGWSQIIRNWIRSKFFRFDSKICHWIDSKGENWNMIWKIQ